MLTRLLEMGDALFQSASHTAWLGQPMQLPYRSLPHRPVSSSWPSVILFITKSIPVGMKEYPPIIRDKLSNDDFFCYLYHQNKAPPTHLPAGSGRISKMSGGRLPADVGQCRNLSSRSPWLASPSQVLHKCRSLMTCVHVSTCCPSPEAVEQPAPGTPGRILGCPQSALCWSSLPSGWCLSHAPRQPCW